MSLTERPASIVASLVAAAVLAASGSSAPGDRDPGFGRAGVVFTDFGGSDDRARELVVQPDGAIVAVGSSVSRATKADFAVARYLPDGRLDRSFGRRGTVVLDFGRSVDEVAMSGVLDRRGNLVLVGGSLASGEDDFALARIRPDGTADPSFGSSGRVLTDVGSARNDLDRANAVALQPDGKIVAVGQTSTGRDRFDFAVARYHPNGVLDAGFGDQGIVRADVVGYLDYAQAVAIQADGKILVGGSSQSAEGDFTVMRFDGAGRLDRSFAGDGVVITVPTGMGFSEVRTLLLLPDGGIVAAGWAAGRVPHCLLTMARLRADGTVDRSFGDGGTVLTRIGSAASAGGFAAALQRDGKIVLVGGSAGRFVVARYLPTGRLDSTFGGTGLVTRALRPGHDEYASAVAVQADGRIIAAGASGSRDVHDFALARYRPDGPAGTRFASLSARWRGEQALVTWRTVAESRTSAFNLYREQLRRRVRLNPKPLRARGGSSKGAVYFSRDPRVPPGDGEVTYWVEEIKHGGRRVTYSPIVLRAKNG
jgi:uncharacterized delta-60 repeat protein